MRREGRQGPLNRKQDPTLWRMAQENMIKFKGMNSPI